MKVEFYANHSIHALVFADGREVGRTIRVTDGREYFMPTDPRLAALEGRRLWGQYTDQDLAGDIGLALEKGIAAMQSLH